tara:strand:- start:107 stop:298 length:192 start_codon:yes stop_codon:yes gene_type:complete
MAHTITDPSKLTVTEISTDLAGMDAAVQTSLRTLAAGDKIIEIIYERQKDSNDIVVNIIWEDQ